MLHALRILVVVVGIAATTAVKSRGWSPDPRADGRSHR
jgi:hypothetical protein